MLKAIGATIDTEGQIHLHEPVKLTHSCRAIVTIIEEEIPETALLSQQTLVEDWERLEEEEAWSHLQ